MSDGAKAKAATRDTCPPLVGVTEIAKIGGVSRTAVWNWRQRFTTFPKPLAELAAGPVFHEDEVRAWLDAYHAGRAV